MEECFSICKGTIYLLCHIDIEQCFFNAFTLDTTKVYFRYLIEYRVDSLALSA